MNTKLDIVRFECDDVIATSGLLCAHKSTNHVYYNGVNNTYKHYMIEFISEHNKTWFYTEDITGGPVNDAGWYYLDENHNPHKCDGENHEDLICDKPLHDHMS